MSNYTESTIKTLLKEFSVYMTNMTTAIQEVKLLVYDLIDISYPSSKKLTVLPEKLSLITAFKRNYDDLKRTESILRGHIKARK